MSAAGDAPWWVTAGITVLTNMATYYFTGRKERLKYESQGESDWRQGMRKAVADVTDQAVRHYTDKDSRENTSGSAALILNGLRRLYDSLDQVHFVVQSNDILIARSALGGLRDAITGHEDFQNAGRPLRGAADPLLETIRNAEERLLNVCNKKVRKR